MNIVSYETNIYLSFYVKKIYKYCLYMYFPVGLNLLNDSCFSLEFSMRLIGFLLK